MTTADPAQRGSDRCERAGLADRSRFGTSCSRSSCLMLAVGTVGVPAVPPPGRLVSHALEGQPDPHRSVRPVRAGLPACTPRGGRRRHRRLRQPLSTRPRTAIAEAETDRPVRRAAAPRRQRLPRRRSRQAPRRPCSNRSPPCSTGAELLAILGNHDVMNGNGESRCAALGMPGRGGRSTIGRRPVRRTRLEPHPTTRTAGVARSDAARPTRRWKIVALHHPPYSAGYQGSSTTSARLRAAVRALRRAARAVGPRPRLPAQQAHRRRHLRRQRRRSRHPPHRRGRASPPSRSPGTTSST